MEKKTVTREIIGILLLAAAVFVGISLVSSDLIFQLLGLSGFILPFLLFINALFCFSPPPWTKIFLKNLSLLIIGLSVGLLFNLFTPKLSFTGHVIPSAGVIGSIINHTSTRYVGKLGAFLIYLVLAWIGLTLLINRSVVSALKPLVTYPSKWRGSQRVCSPSPFSPQRSTTHRTEDR